MAEITKIFISATSADLGTCRQTVKQALLTLGIHPVEQENFPPDYRTIKEMLRETIRGCDAVIHIAGFVYGAEPQERRPQEMRRSYTQLEYDIARELKKPLYVFVAGEQFPFDEHEAESLEKRELQRAYREELRGRDEKRTEIGSRDQLENRVRELQIDLEKLRRGFRLERKAVLIGIAILAPLLTAITVGTLHLMRGQVRAEREQDSIKRETLAAKALLEQVLAQGREGQQLGQELTPQQRYDRAVEEVAFKHGLDVAELRAAIDAWVARVEEDPKADLYDKALASYQRHEFDQAAQQASAAAEQTLAKIELAQAQLQVDRAQAIKELTLLGEAQHAAYRFSQAALAYQRALAQVEKESNPSAWARLTLLIHPRKPPALLVRTQ